LLCHTFCISETISSLFLFYRQSPLGSFSPPLLFHFSQFSQCFSLLPHLPLILFVYTFSPLPLSRIVIYSQTIARPLKPHLLQLGSPLFFSSISRSSPFFFSQETVFVRSQFLDNPFGTVIILLVLLRPPVLASLASPHWSSARNYFFLGPNFIKEIASAPSCAQVSPFFLYSPPHCRRHLFLFSLSNIAHHFFLRPFSTLFHWSFSFLNRGSYINASAGSVLLLPSSTLLDTPPLFVLRTCIFTILVRHFIWFPSSPEFPSSPPQHEASP